MKTVYGVTGYDGHVGRELMKFPNVVPLPCDVRKSSEIQRALKNVKPDVVIHLASISDVDECEDKKNQKKVDETNVRGVFYVAEETEKIGCGMVLLSTAHVFDGVTGNYHEKSNPNPKNYYGFSKLAAEGLRELFPHLKVVRTSYLFDYDRLFRHIYPLRAGHPYEYPTFIYRSFMYLPHFAEALYSYVKRFSEMPRVLHIGGTLTVSWHDFIEDAANVFGLDSSLVCPRDHEIDGEFAPRPFRGGLRIDLSKSLGLPQFSYMDGLQEVKDINL